MSFFVLKITSKKIGEVTFYFDFICPHRITTVEMLLSVGTHLRVLDDNIKLCYLLLN
jgi:hypothetical protein